MKALLARCRDSRRVTNRIMIDTFAQAVVGDAIWVRI